MALAVSVYAAVSALESLITVVAVQVDPITAFSLTRKKR